MEYIVFDVEATGLTNRDEVFQFSGLLLDEDLKLQKVISFYCYTQVPLHPTANRITGMNAEKIMQLSGGRFFEDYYYKFDIFRKKDIVWIGYNNSSYDQNIINSTLCNNGLPPHSFGNYVTSLNVQSGVHHFDLMRFLSARNQNRAKKLSVAQKDIGYSEQKLEAMYKKLLNLMNITSTVKEHNSLYDAMVTWLLLYKNRKAVGK